MFPDVSITYATVASTLPKIVQRDMLGRFENPDGTLAFQISHETTNKERQRHLIRLERKIIAANPLDNADQDYETMSLNLVIDRPLVGFSATDVDNLVATLKGWLTTANVTRVYGRES